MTGIKRVARPIRYARRVYALERKPRFGWAGVARTLTAFARQIQIATSVRVTLLITFISTSFLQVLIYKTSDN